MGVDDVAKRTLAKGSAIDSTRSMPSLTSIVAVGLDGEIGVENRLPWRLKSDLRFFQKMTRENIVIMGRKTFESIGGCLPRRDNIVLSHKATLFEPHTGCVQAHDIGETLYRRNEQPKKQAYVIGGALTYAQFAPFVDRYLITFVSAKFANADAFCDRQLLGHDHDWIEREIPVERLDERDADEFDFRVMELTHRDPALLRARQTEEIRQFETRNPFLYRKLIQSRAKDGESLDQILSHA